jgi:uncharacterized protein (TIGR00251 family)
MPAPLWHETKAGVLVPIRVIPRSHRNALSLHGDTLHARLTAPPVEGAANEALIALIAAQLDLPKRNVTIVQGQNRRQKLIAIAGLHPEEIRRRLSHN